MADDYFISIIVPVYNAEKFIDNCLKSLDLDGQYTHGLEVLVVDDGSQDNTAKVVAVWSEKYPNVKLLQKENGGVSSARNYGINEAKGEYIFFSDADDEVNRKTLEEMISIAEKQSADLVIADYIQQNIFEGGDKEENYISCLIEEGKYNKEYIETVIFRRIFNYVNDGLTNLWNKLYRKDIIQKNGIIFNEKLSYGEDLMFNISYFLNVKTLYAISRPIYLYKVEEGRGNHFNRYRKGLAYSLICGHRMAISLNERFLNYKVTSNEYLRLMSGFAYRSLKYLSLKACSNEEKKQFLSSKEEKEVWSFLLRLNKERLFAAGYSRRDKLAFLLLRAKRWKWALKLLGRREE